MPAEIDYQVGCSIRGVILNTLYCRHTLEGHGGWVSDCAVLPGNEAAITVSGDDLAVVWDLLSGSCKNVLEGHSGEILSVVLTRKGRFAVTGSSDGTARIWDLAAGSAHLQRAHTGRVHGLTATADKNYVVSFGKLIPLGMYARALGRRQDLNWTLACAEIWQGQDSSKGM